MRFHSEKDHPFGLFGFIVINAVVIACAENRKNIIIVRPQFEFNAHLNAHSYINFMFENCQIFHISLSLIPNTYPRKRRRKKKHQMHTHT